MAKAMSGVKCSDEVVKEYKCMKLDHNRRYAIFHIVDKFIEVETSVDKDPNKTQKQQYEEFVASLPTTDDRYCLVDLQCPTKSGSLNDKMFLIKWCPDAAGAKKHIPYTASVTAMKHHCESGTIEIQANDISDLDYDELIEKGTK